MHKRKTQKFTIGSLSTATSFIGFLLSAFKIDGIWAILSGILICVGIAITFLIFVIDFINKDIISKENVIKMGNNVIANTADTIVLYGGDISWAQDYSSEIRKLVLAHKTVEIIYPSEKRDITNLQILHDVGASIYSIPKDLGYRFIISDPGTRDSVVFLTSKVRRNLNDVKPDSNKYKANVYTYQDELIFDSFEKIHSLSTQTRILDTGFVSNVR